MVDVLNGTDEINVANINGDQSSDAEVLSGTKIFREDEVLSGATVITGAKMLSGATVINEGKMLSGAKAITGAKMMDEGGQSLLGTRC